MYQNFWHGIKVGACIVDADHKIVGIGHNKLPHGVNEETFPYWTNRDVETHEFMNTKYPYGEYPPTQPHAVYVPIALYLKSSGHITIDSLILRPINYVLVIAIHVIIVYINICSLSCCHTCHFEQEC